jgi:hypothetical protein
MYMKFFIREKRYANHVKASITERLAQFLQREREREREWLRVYTLYNIFPKSACNIRIYPENKKVHQLFFLYFCCFVTCNIYYVAYNESSATYSANSTACSTAVMNTN